MDASIVEWSDIAVGKHNIAVIRQNEVQTDFADVAQLAEHVLGKDEVVAQQPKSTTLHQCSDPKAVWVV